jgi:hypothetical protein
VASKAIEAELLCLGSEAATEITSGRQARGYHAAVTLVEGD